MIGHVNLQWRDRDAAVAGDENRCRRPLPGITCGANPVNGVPTRVGLRNGRTAGMAAPQSGHVPRRFFQVFNRGHVDIQQPGPVAGGRARTASTTRRATRAALSRWPQPRRSGKTQWRAPRTGSFRGRRHRTGVQGVVAHVGAIVDARQHQIRLGNQARSEGQMHAVRRGAGDKMEAAGGRVNGQRVMEREGIDVPLALRSGANTSM